MLCLVKMSLKVEVGGCALNTHGNYIIDHGKSSKNHGIVFLNFCGNPELYTTGACSPVLTVCQSLTLYLLVSSGDNLCKQLGPRSGPTKGRTVWIQIRHDIWFQTV